MIEAVHIFIYVVPAGEDAFAGLRAALTRAGAGRHPCCDIRLEATEYELVRKVEFSARKYARFAYYGSIFRHLEEQLRALLVGRSQRVPVVLYLSDEGVWAELLDDLRSRLLGGRTSLLVNVQHGFFLLQRPRTKLLRRFANFVARRTFGYPIFGYGFGGGAFDVHLAYGDLEAQFLRERGIERVYACPRLVKYDLLQRCASLAASTAQRDGQWLLLALPACTPGTEMRCSLGEFLEVMVPIVRWIATETPFRVLVRPHPGRRDPESLALVDRSALRPWIQVDTAEDLVPSLAKSTIVMAAHSTVLFDALTIGKVPVAVRSRCFEQRIHFQHEVVDVRGDYPTALRAALDPTTAQRYAVEAAQTELDWRSEVVQLLRAAS